MRNTVLVIGDRKFVNAIYSVLSSLGIGIVAEVNEQRIRNSCKSSLISTIIFDDDLKNQSLRLRILKTLKTSKKDFIIVSSRQSPSAVWEAKEFGAADFILKPYNHREFIARFNAVIQKKTRITCIGGGTGLFHLLLGLKNLPDVLLASVVSTSDDGGSSGKLRASFGILPPGDVRRSLVALSNAPEIMNQVIQYRFKKGEGISGHSFGNLFLTVLTEIKGSLSEAVRTIGDILNIQGIVLPMTNTQTTLCARFEDGTVIKGESKIDLCEARDPSLSIQEIWHEPKTKSNIDALSSIINSDIVTIGPGDLFTSVITNLLVKDIREAVSRTKAKKIYICNLMTEPGETTKYTAFDHVKEVIKYMKGDHLDYIIISNTKLSERAIREYARKYQSPVGVGDIKRICSITKADVIIADVGHETELVRHDSIKIKNVVSNILKHKISCK